MTLNILYIIHYFVTKSIQIKNFHFISYEISFNLWIENMTNWNSTEIGWWLFSIYVSSLFYFYTYISFDFFLCVILKIFNLYFIAKYLSFCHESKFNSLSEMIDFIQQRVPFPVYVEISIQTIEISSGCKTSDGMFHRWYM